MARQQFQADATMHGGKYLYCVVFIAAVDCPRADRIGVHIASDPRYQVIENVLLALSGPMELLSFLLFVTSASLPCRAAICGPCSTPNGVCSCVVPSNRACVPWRWRLSRL